MKARILSGSFSPGARSTPDDTSTAGARGDAQRLGDVAGIEPARQHERHAERRDFPASVQSKVLPSPPGPRRLARRAGVEQQPVGDLGVEPDRRRDRRASRSAAPSSPAGETASAPRRRAPASPGRAVAACRACSASTMRSSSASLASTDSATFLARPFTRSPSARAASTPRLRGDGGKNTKPTMSAPASSATSSASGVFRPQILTRRDMAPFL